MGALSRVSQGERRRGWWKGWASQQLPALPRAHGAAWQ